MKPTDLLGAASALLFLLAVPCAADTIVLGPPTYSGSSFYIYAYGDGQSFTPTGPTAFSYSANSVDPLNHPATALATLNIAATPFPSIMASASAGIGGTASVSGQMSYYFSIQGPARPFGDFIPLVVTFSGGATSSGGSDVGATSHFNIAGSNFADAYTVVVGAFPSSIHQTNGISTTFAGSSFSGNSPYQIAANDFYRIDLRATASAFGIGFASAFIDPYLQIDPGFADASLYSIVLSQGVGNIVPAVPLPAALPLFGTALLGLGAAGLRRKRRGMRAA